MNKPSEFQLQLKQFLAQGRETEVTNKCMLYIIYIITPLPDNSAKVIKVYCLIGKEFYSRRVCSALIAGLSSEPCATEFDVVIIICSDIYDARDFLTIS